MAVSEFVFEKQIQNSEELDDEDCGRNGGFLVHLVFVFLNDFNSNILTFVVILPIFFPEIFCIVNC